MNAKQAKTPTRNTDATSWQAQDIAICANTEPLWIEPGDLGDWQRVSRCSTYPNGEIEIWCSRGVKTFNPSDIVPVCVARNRKDYLKAAAAAYLASNAA